MYFSLIKKKNKQTIVVMSMDYIIKQAYILSINYTTLFFPLLTSDNLEKQQKRNGKM